MSVRGEPTGRRERVDTPGGRGVSAGRSTRSAPLLRLLLYYFTLVATGLLLMRLVPGMVDALVAPIAPMRGGVDELLGGAPAAVPPTLSPWAGVTGRGALTLVAVLGALALALPVAWVHMHTRRFRYDPSLVHAIIVLPIVVAGVVLVVKNSLALAFALAGIVAGVRFRQKLNEPQEAVYVLLSLGIGLAAGVQALDVALVMSALFNGVVLLFWRYDIGAIYAGERGGALAVGDARLLPPAGSAPRRQAEEHALASRDGLEADGFLIVHARDAAEARRSIDVAVGRVAREWRSTEAVADDSGLTRFEVLLEFRKSAGPVDLMAELEERCSRDVAAAEYVPLGAVRRDEAEE